jgi:hypothetical protein
MHLRSRCTCVDGTLIQMHDAPNQPDDPTRPDAMRRNVKHHTPPNAMQYPRSGSSPPESITSARVHTNSPLSTQTQGKCVSVGCTRLAVSVTYLCERHVERSSELHQIPLEAELPLYPVLHLAEHLVDHGRLPENGGVQIYAGVSDDREHRQAQG